MPSIKKSTTRDQARPRGRQVSPQHVLQYDLTGLTPEDLARQAQAGSLPAFTQLVAVFETRLFNFLLRRTGSWDDAEEMTQETFVRAWERIDRYDDQWRFSTWLFTIGSRLAVSHHRSKKRMVASSAMEYRADDGPSPVDRAEQRESKSPTWELAARVLTEAQHTALWLRYAEGLSMKEIAEVMGKTQVSVRVTLFRARDHLATQIRRIHAEAQNARNPQDQKHPDGQREQIDERILADPSILALLQA